MNEMQSGPAAGWYEDPSGSGGRRYWDGATWAADTTVVPPGAVLSSDDTTPVADPTGESGGYVSGYVATPSYTSLMPPDGVVPLDGHSPVPGMVAVTKKRRWPLWTAIGVGALLLLVAIGALSGKDDTKAASSSASPTTSAAPTTQAPASTTQAPATTAVPIPTTTVAPVTTAAPTTTAPAAKVGTRANPVPMGQAGVLKDADNGDITITVNAADLNGSAAVAAANMFNPASSTGEYAVVNVTAAYAGGKKEQSTTLLEAVSFSVFGSAGVEHSSSFAVAPDPQLDMFADMLAGGSMTGNEVFEYEPGAAPLLRVEESICFSNCDVLWFSLV